MSDHDDASVIVSALQEGPDYQKMGASMISLMLLSEEFRRADKWTQARVCCDQLEKLAQDPDILNIPDIDSTYVSGIAKITKGVIDLSRNQLADAEANFSKSQVLFHDASAEYSEAVALVALGIVHQTSNF